MTGTMSRFAAYALVFLTGVLLGGVSASHVWLVATNALQEGSLANFTIEQEFLADRAKRDGDSFREVVHRINAADAQTELGFRWLQRSRNEKYLERFTFPWKSYWVLQTTDLHPSTEKYERGQAIMEGESRAAAALALERFGAPDLAKAQWARAAELNPGWSPSDHRDYQERLKPTDEGLESAYLDSSSWQELEAALAQVRRTQGSE